MRLTEQQMFDHYKKRIESGAPDRRTRFNVIQYLCSFPNIDPYKMAATVVDDGFYIAFDDSSISVAENQRNRRRVCETVEG